MGPWNKGTQMTTLKDKIRDAVQGFLEQRAELTDPELHPAEMLVEEITDIIKDYAERILQ